MSSMYLVESLKGYIGRQDLDLEIAAKNTSNANVPGYKTKEVLPFSFDDMVKMDNSFSMKTTSVGHIQNETTTSLNSPVRKKRKMEENTISGNNVSLIDETQRAKEAQMNQKLGTLMYKTVMSFSSIAMGNNE